MNQTNLFAAVRRLPLICILAASGLAAATADLTGDSILDIRDCQRFVDLLAAGDVRSLAHLDMNRDGLIDLRDAAAYAQWVQGTFADAAHGFALQCLSNPADGMVWDAYGRNLAVRKNTMTADMLKARYPDAASARPLNYRADTVEFAARSRALFANQAFVDQVLRQGMAVDKSSRWHSFQAAFDAIHTADMPVLITTDAILHALLKSYDDILMTVETRRFIPQLESALTLSLRYLERSWPASAEYNDVKDYLTVALCLLDPGRADVARSPVVVGALAAVSAEQSVGMDLFGCARVIDFSQFKPRGHYTEMPALGNYFRAMMWLSRADCCFAIGGKEATARMKKASLVLWDCIMCGGAFPAWYSMNDLLEYMVGVSDGLSVKSMGALARGLNIRNMQDYVGRFPESSFDSAVAAGRYGMQSILSSFKIYDGLVDDLKLPAIFAFMPQRFIQDSYTFSQLVFPLTRLRLPSSLNIAFVLGDNSALADNPDLSYEGVPGILCSQRDLWDNLSTAGWKTSMYGHTIRMLRSLNGVESNPLVSPVFRTHAWLAKMRNTQLMSWARLRSATILYAKQSMTGGACQHPSAYVEPYPEFFNAVADYANDGAARFQSIDGGISSYFKDVSAIAGKLQVIATRTAQGKMPLPEQVAWLKAVVTGSNEQIEFYTSKLYDGWYFDCIYTAGPLTDEGGNPIQVYRTINGASFTIRDFDGVDDDLFDKSTCPAIADVHTDPYEDGTPARILHAAAGFVQLMGAVIQLDTCTAFFVGPVGSYYDVVTVGAPAARLSKEEWQQRLLRDPTIARPSWCAEFLYP